MKRILLVLTFIGLTVQSKSQTVSVEQSTFGIETGFLGIWGHNEYKLSNQIALRAELGFDFGIGAPSHYNETIFYSLPVITLDPRWYYNLDKRDRKSKRIEGNSGNFVSIKTSYHPDWFVISSLDNVEVIPDISIVPTWGIRRQSGNHFIYESGIGVGYRHVIEEDTGSFRHESKVLLNLHLRIGYRI